ncbi:STM3941 family protein [Roseibium suaedae]|uniref:PH domain-containing protein n=1 Tax=Roseibium suaedae TaxID=735517 RepID=A0A1M7GCS6_9HYPH|nr:STM3941 family protein [Roseibium suaedae]SHM13747.1 hypothetical protein SAMN05444272_1875 [Roseibium suaedae]
MHIDTTRSLEISGSPLKRIGLFLLSPVMVAVSLFPIIYTWGTPEANSLAVFFCYIGVVLFSACGVLILWRLFRQTGTVIELRPDGIRDIRVAAEVIPWSAVQDIYTWTYQRQSIMVISVPHEVEQTLSLTRIARWSRRANTALGADGLCIGATGLTISYDQLLDATLQYLAAWQATQKAT